MPTRTSLLRQARYEAIEVCLSDLLNDEDAMTAVLSDRVPDWLCNELVCEGVQLYQERHGAWILAPLDDGKYTRRATATMRTTNVDQTSN
jgi:hypothetical protein